jgi:hypothetical protein
MSAFSQKQTSWKFGSSSDKIFWGQALAALMATVCRKNPFKLSAFSEESPGAFEQLATPR